jgi:hypothetical protein
MQGIFGIQAIFPDFPPEFLEIIFFQDSGGEILPKFGQSQFQHLVNTK